MALGLTRVQAERLNDRLEAEERTCRLTLCIDNGYLCPIAYSTVCLSDLQMTIYSFTMLLRMTCEVAKHSICEQCR